MLGEVLVELEPPERGGGHQEKLRAAGAGRFQFGDGLRAICGMMAGIVPVRRLREMRGGASAQLQQLMIAFADDSYRSARRNRRPGHFPNVAHQLAVLTQEQPARRPAEGLTHKRRKLRLLSAWLDELT